MKKCLLAMINDLGLNNIQKLFLQTWYLGNYNERKVGLRDGGGDIFYTKASKKCLVTHL